MSDGLGIDAYDCQECLEDKTQNKKSHFCRLWNTYRICEVKMNSTVDKILKLFDDLDAEESISLTDLLQDRGYELKINRELKPRNRELKKYGIYLNSFNTSYIIRAIKSIRNMHIDYKDYIDGRQESLTLLKETKNFCENPSQWPDTPIVWGDLDKLVFIVNSLEKENEDHIIFEIQELGKKKTLIDENGDIWDDPKPPRGYWHTNDGIPQRAFSGKQLPRYFDTEEPSPEKIRRPSYPNNVCENH